MDENNRVQQARLHIVEFRGFERFIQGGPSGSCRCWSSVCAGSARSAITLCAAKAIDGIIGAENLTPTAEKMRRLMHYGQMFQSHALHFFHLASPDLLFGFDAPVEKRNVIGVIADYPDLAVQGVMMRKFGQEIIKATAGKKVHGTGAIPGGINKNLSVEERDALLADMDQMMEWSLKAVEIAKNYTLENLERLPSSAPSTPITSLSSATMAPWISITASSERWTRMARPSSTRSSPLDYLDVIAEEVRPWSYMKFPFLKRWAGGRVVPCRSAGADQHLRLHRHPGCRGGASGVHGSDRWQAEQRDHGLPLDSDDRAAALGREDPGAARRRRSPGR